MALSLLLVGVGLLSATVIPTEELEANKPQLQSTPSGNALRLDWTTQPEVYYFVEGSPSLDSWVAAKLLKDNTEEGTLSLDAAIGSGQAFFRLSLEGDPGSARLRADDDGDKIINLLEVKKGMDAFKAEDPEDLDLDGIPDYWERVHFETLEHDASYIDIEEGLTLAEAFEHATDPTVINSDGDDWTDAQEIDWAWEPNYDQSRDDLRYSLNGDFDGDGVSNSVEALNGTSPADALSTVDLSKHNYGIIDLGSDFGVLKVSNQGHVLMAGSAIYRRWFWGKCVIIPQGRVAISFML